ncbi:MAG: hypothetical protein L6R37_002636 [Teloschistes peruensis]|nr:MAG: hypothetical protein L6R37_002636 [Teloschistes peruensis]
MLGASFLPARFRSDHGHVAPSNPGAIHRYITSVLQSVARSAFTHPIHTIVFVALLASTSYVGVLEGSLVEPSPTLSPDSLHSVNVTTLLDGARQLEVGRDTNWKWTTAQAGVTPQETHTKHLALVTLVFPNSLSNIYPRTAPLANEIRLPKNTSAHSLPRTSNALHPISQDSTLSYSMPYDHMRDFLGAVQEIPNGPTANRQYNEWSPNHPRAWVMKAAKSDNDDSPRPLTNRVTGAWSGFLDLIKNAETLDIVIMFLGYLSMHLTFVSLFLSMRRMGSNVWLATSVLLNSVFAFLFGLIVTTKLGVPISFVLLSEGLPFLVVTIGFEKPILLTKAVLTASLNPEAGANKPSGKYTQAEGSPRTIESALHVAVREQGFAIVRDYCIEIAILIAGAASGVQGGLRQFCFLAAWILAFDCVLLFTFYTAILSMKLEINRIKRHVTLRRALEEDGLSRRVAENVASRNDWPKHDSLDDGQVQEGTSPFGNKVRDSSVPKFKVLMVTGFILLNAINLCTIPFRTANGVRAAPPTVSGLPNVLMPHPMDPFKVAQNGLDYIHNSAKDQNTATLVTVLHPIKYDLELYYGDDELDEPGSILEGEYADQIFRVVVGGRVLEGILKSLEDPVLSKWIIVALTMSLILNGYLFNAARWTIKEPRSEDEHVAEVPAISEPQHIEPEEPQPNGHVVAPKSDAVDHLVTDVTASRTPLECEQMLSERKAAFLHDAELTDLAVRGKIPGYALEKTLENTKVMSRLTSLTRAVKIRRALVSRTPATSGTTSQLERSKVPYLDYNYENVHGACCENVIGYMPLPLGAAGPYIIDGQHYYIPMATTEGVLVASTNRGCKAINAAGGALTVLTGDGMTRGPCVGFETLARAGAAKVWLDSDEGQKMMKSKFDSTSRFARLQSMKTALAGTYLYIRFKTTTGDAMGMNMISKGVECALRAMMEEAGFEDMAIISVSGNYCTDKKPAAINWVDGRGKSVVAEAIIPGHVVQKVLKSDVNALVELNTSKNLIGSAMAGSIGGFNAHAANIVTAIFLATGQDPAQNVESSNCITVMRNLDGNLQISVSMPSIEVGTVGGGTILEPQSAMLDLLGVRGPHPTEPGANARKLARIVAASVLAGELSLCSALAAGHLVSAHMKHNRSVVPTRSTTPVSGNLSAAGAERLKAAQLSMAKAGSTSHRL